MSTYNNTSMSLHIHTYPDEGKALPWFFHWCTYMFLHYFVHCVVVSQTHQHTHVFFLHQSTKVIVHWCLTKVINKLVQSYARNSKYIKLIIRKSQCLQYIYSLNDSILTSYKIVKKMYHIDFDFNDLFESRHQTSAEAAFLQPYDSSESWWDSFSTMEKTWNSGKPSGVT